MALLSFPSTPLSIAPSCCHTKPQSAGYTHHWSQVTGTPVVVVVVPLVVFSAPAPPLQRPAGNINAKRSALLTVRQFKQSTNIEMQLQMYVFYICVYCVYTNIYIYIYYICIYLYVCLRVYI